MNAPPPEDPAEDLPQDPPPDGPGRGGGLLDPSSGGGAGMLRSSDLEGIALKGGAAWAEPEEEPDLFDAVEAAAAEASVAYLAQHGEDGPPPPEDEPESPAVWAVPWVISLLAHAGLVVVAIFIVWSVQEVLQDDEVVIPLVTLSEAPGAPLEVQVPERVEVVPVDPAPAPTPPEPAEAKAPEAEPEPAPPALGEPAPAEAPTFELPLEDAAEFDTNFFGSGGNAKNIVFVLEADGSIISDFPQIVRELFKTLDGMSPQQRFSVVVFDGRGTKEPPPRGLRPATADAKGRVKDWLRDTRNVQNFGTGDPVAALNRAFRYRPDLVFLLSQNLYNPGRRQYEVERQEILDAVERGTRRHGIVVNTIEFNDVDRLAFDPGGNKIRLTLLEEIAQNTGGAYLWVVTNRPAPGGPQP